VRFELTRGLLPYGFSRAALSTAQPLFQEAVLRIVDPMGVEPTTSPMPWARSAIELQALTALTAILCPYEELNPDLLLRSELLDPLSYRGHF
jgi:hypothetical protein